MILMVKNNEVSCGDENKDDDGHNNNEDDDIAHCSGHVKSSRQK